MANPDYPAGAFFKDKMQPRVLEDTRKESDKKKKLEAAYAKVNEREQNRCQVSGYFLKPTAHDDRYRREHHHLKGRNVKPEWKFDPKRILLCSSYIHKLLQAKLIRVEGNDATKKPLVFTWDRERVPPGKEPMRLGRVS